jgi:hypothetical protein
MTGRPPYVHARAAWLRLDARRVVLAAAGVAVTGLILANVHLVYVAVSSAPDCVAHIKERGDPASGGFRAARPSC